MTKHEQNRLVAWRLKLLRQASDLPRVARTAGISAFRAKTSTNGEPGTKVTVMLACAIRLERFVRSAPVCSGTERTLTHGVGAAVTEPRCALQ